MDTLQENRTQLLSDLWPDRPRKDRYPQQLLSDFIVIEDGFIVIKVKPGYDYNIDLASIESEKDLTHWLGHLYEKRWMSPQKLDYFYKLAKAAKGMP